MVDWILDGLQQAWGWFSALVVGVVEGIWSGVVWSLPSIPSFDALQQFEAYLSIANQYVPLAEAVSFYVGHYVFIAGFIVVKTTLKAIPFIG
mgnify:CR=1 FL=1